MLTCELCEQEEAMFTIIPTGQGAPQVLGLACYARQGLELAKQILPAEEIAETLGPMFVAPPKSPDKKRKRAESPQPPAGPKPPTTDAGDESDDDADKDAKAGAG